jgi:hypothetical protein
MVDLSQQCLYFFPLPHGQRAFLSGEIILPHFQSFEKVRIAGFECQAGATACAANPVLRPGELTALCAERVLKRDNYLVVNSQL